MWSLTDLGSTFFSKSFRIMNPGPVGVPSSDVLPLGPEKFTVHAWRGREQRARARTHRDATKIAFVFSAALRLTPVDWSAASAVHGNKKKRTHHHREMYGAGQACELSYAGKLATTT